MCNTNVSCVRHSVCARCVLLLLLQSQPLDPSHNPRHALTTSSLFRVMLEEHLHTVQFGLCAASCNCFLLSHICFQYVVSHHHHTCTSGVRVIPQACIASDGSASVSHHFSHSWSAAHFLSQHRVPVLARQHVWDHDTPRRFFSNAVVYSVA